MGSPTLLLRLAGFLIAASAAALADWSLAEFCWSTWLAGLLVTWLCVLTGGAQIVATAPRWRETLERRAPALKRLSPGLQIVLIVTGAVVLTAVAFRAYSFLFGFYGLFLSFFAEMEPHALFGRNGFINSDFWTPVRYLAQVFWAMSIGTIVAFAPGIARSNPWKRMLLPFATEIVRVHVMVVVMPVLALIAWAVLGEAYHSVVIVLLMFVFFLLPRRSPEREIAPERPAGEHGAGGVAGMDSEDSGLPGESRS
jgi:hypothetical protein